MLSVSVQQTATAMESHRSSTILLDCRSYMAYNTSHIRTAHNVFCPAIVKRRAAGSLTLTNIIACSATRQRLQQGEYEFVVVYDEASRCVAELEPDTTAELVFKTLEAANISNVNFLEGGFAAFSAKFPHLCTVSPHLNPAQKTLPCSSDRMQFQDQVVPGMTSSHANHLNVDKEPVQILPWLYLGCIRHARQEELLRRLEITALLDISVEDQLEVLSPDIAYKKIPVTDTSTSDIRQWFPMAMDFIEGVRKDGGRVLVHCHMGISRSATICLAYLIQHKKFNLDEAFKYIQSRRSVINPNFNFMRQLENFASETRSMSQRRPAKRKPDLTLSIASPYDLQKPHFDFCPPNVTVAFTSPFSAPCNIQATTSFEFSGVPLSPLVSSSPLPFCHSPLLSPS